VLDELVPAAWHHVEQYANNPIEADHGQVKRRLRPMCGLQTDRTAQVVIAGHAFVQNLRRGHYELSPSTSVPAAGRDDLHLARPGDLTCPAGLNVSTDLATQQSPGAEPFREPMYFDHVVDSASAGAGRASGHGHISAGRRRTLNPPVRCQVCKRNPEPRYGTGCARRTGC
jgi:hypothetical protein